MQKKAYKLILSTAILGTAEISINFNDQTIQLNLNNK